MTRWMLRSLAAALVLTCSAAAFAGPPTDEVKAKQTKIVGLLKQPGNEKTIAGLLDDMFDYDAFAQASLGDEWAARSDAEKAQFTQLLKQLVQRSYQRNLKKLGDFDVDYLGEEADGGATVVKTKARSKAADARTEPIQIDYKLAQKNGKWKILDIVTDETSFVSRNRGDFTRIIKKDGFGKLIEKMKDKLAKPD